MIFFIRFLSSYIYLILPAVNKSAVQQRHMMLRAFRDVCTDRTRKHASNSPNGPNINVMKLIKAIFMMRQLITRTDTACMLSVSMCEFVWVFMVDANCLKFQFGNRKSACVSNDRPYCIPFVVGCSFDPTYMDLGSWIVRRYVCVYDFSAHSLPTINISLLAVFISVC